MKRLHLISISLSLLIFIFLTLPAFFTPNANKAIFLSKVSWNLIISLCAFLIFSSGRISRYRSIIFIISAWAFLIEFKAYIFNLHSSAFISDKVQEVPYCHIAIVSTILNFFYNQYLALSSGRWEVFGPLYLGFLWLAVTLAIGQGFCSWGCFYGGFDEGFSKISKRPLFKLNIPQRLRDLPAALMVSLIMISLALSLPVFCLWLCPLKVTTAFLDPNTGIRKLQMFIFIFIGLLFLVILPLILKKRTFCALICPFGAWQAFWGRFSPYRLRIIKEKCIQCKKCLEACPVFAISKEGLSKYQISNYCNRCGECLDVCPANAIEINQRLPFLFFCLLISGSISNLFVPQAVLRVLKGLL